MLPMAYPAINCRAIIRSEGVRCLNGDGGTPSLPILVARRTSGQVFMTCTEENWPRELGKDLQRWNVKQGKVERV